ncbi:choice-of-anchor J domain-containing protein [Bacteroidales bacterium OttesenSCG-928-I14]|nr:choice-of-anchor J domain-containing protein [Bacteroidales bacterium OttesenSCG-928-I14]
MGKTLLTKLTLTLLLVMSCLGYSNAQTTVKAQTDFYAYCHSATSTTEYGPTKFSLSQLDNVSLIKNDYTYYPHAGEYVNGTWYAYMCYYNPEKPQTFVTINLSTGAYSTLGTVIGGYGGYLDTDYVADMAYSYKDEKMYALKNVTENILTTVDLTSATKGIHAVVDTLTGPDAKLMTLACSFAGKLYAIGDDAKLYEIKVEEKTATLIGDLNIAGLSFNYRQSMSFDHNTGTLYWLSENGKLYTINTTTGAATLSGSVTSSNRRMTSLFTVFNKVDENTPSMPLNLTATTGEGANLALTLKWNNPTKTVEGNALTLTAVKIYRDADLIDTYTTNLTNGAEITWSDSAPIAGSHTYKIVPVNSNGNGVASSVNVYLGIDTPNPVTNLQLSVDNNGKPTLTWDAPTTGVNGGAIGALTYDILRDPGNVNVVSDITATTYTDNAEFDLGKYAYSVIAKSAAGSSAATITVATVLGTPLSIPWREDFDFVNDFNLWTIINANPSPDNVKWTRYTSGGKTTSGSVTCGVTYASGISNNDDWLITPPIKLDASKKYMLRWADKCYTASKTVSYNLAMGSAATVEAQTTALGAYSINETGAPKYYDKELVLPAISTTGTYYFAWQCTSANGSGSANLYIDDIEIVELLENDLLATSLSGDKGASVGFEQTYTLNVKNQGSANVTAFTVKLYDEAETLLASAPFAGTLALGESTNVILKWTPNAAAEGNRTLKALVEYAADQDTANNSAELNVTVYPFGSIISTINTPAATSISKVPFNLNRYTSVSQHIFFENEVNAKGMIEEISFYSEYKNAVQDVEVEVYMTTTTTSTLYKTWIKDGEVLVYKGKVNIPAGTASEPAVLKITLDDPYYYGGNNLVIRTVRVRNVDNYISNASDIKFKTAGNTSNRSAYFNFNTDEPFNWQTATGYENLAYHPQIAIAFNLDGNSLSGSVGSLENVKVKVLDTNFETTTDAQGKYTFPMILSGTYQVEFSKLGYENLVKEVVIALGEPIVLNAELERSATVDVNGKVVLDENSNPIVGATVILKSDSESFTTATNADGEFLLEDVTSDKTYTITVFNPVYKEFSDEVIVEAVNVDLGEIELSICTSNAIGNLQAVAHIPAWYDIKLSWTEANPGLNSIVGHRIYRNDTFVTQVGPNQTSYNDKDLQPGTYTYKVTAFWSDGCESGPRISSPVEIELHECDVPIVDFPYKEGFESGNIASCWTQEQVTPGAYIAEWKVVDNGCDTDAWSPVEAPHSGKYNLYLKGYKPYPIDEPPFVDSRLILPIMDISELNTPVLTFWFSSGRRAGRWDDFAVYYQNVKDGEWKLLGDYSENYVDLWTEIRIILPEASEYYRIAFQGEVFNGHGITLDDIRVFDDNLCPEVRNLTYVQETEKNVKLSWNEPDAFFFTSYSIYRDGVVIKENLTETTFTDTEATIGNHEYAVKVIYDKEGCSESELTTIQVVVEGRCEMVENLEANVASFDTVELSWEAPNTVNILSYNIYRDNTLIKNTTETTYTDSDFDTTGGTLNYCVAVVYSGKDCTESEKACVSVNTTCSPATNLQLALENNNKVTLTWEGDKEIASFQIIRNGEALNTVKDNKYVDRGLPAGDTYEYEVIAVYDDGCQSESVAKSIETVCAEIVELDVFMYKGLAEDEECHADLTWKVPGDYEVVDDVVCDNGPYVNIKGAGPKGEDIASISMVDRVEVWRTLKQKFVDDFVLTKDTYVEEVTFYTYADISNYVNLDYDITAEDWDEIAAEMVVGLYVTIYDGNPALDGTLIWGADGDTSNPYAPDPEANIIKSCKYAYALTEEGYHIFKVTAKVETIIPAGEYWIGFNTDSDSENTWYINGAYAYHVPGVEGNAYVLKTHMLGDGTGGWFPATTREGVGMTMPFTMKGYSIPDMYNIYRDGSLIEEEYLGNKYTDTVNEGDHTWEVSRICPNGETAVISVTGECNGDVNIDLPGMNDLRVYPNPAQDYVMFSGLDLQSVDIYDLSGKFVESLDFSNGREPRITVSQYSTGTYLFVVKDTKGQTVTKVVMIK